MEMYLSATVCSDLISEAINDYYRLRLLLKESFDTFCNIKSCLYMSGAGKSSLLH